MRDLTQLQRVHIVGIGGAGMSAIARVLHGRGIAVSGSDRSVSPITEALTKEGIKVNQGHMADSLGDVDLVLASSAIPDDNVELKTARERGINIQRRPEFLPTLTSGYDVVAIAGAHGKTTVTAMLAYILTVGGIDPTFIVGGVMNNLGTNARCGKSAYFLIEADEYRNTYHGLHSKIAVVTNIEYDHPDFFPSLRYLRWSFGEFVNNIRQDGLLIACHDDEIVHAIAASYHANGGRVQMYGSRGDAGLSWQVSDIQQNSQGGVTFNILHEDHTCGSVSLKVPGDFNAVNALAATAVATEIGVPWQTIQLALCEFTGTARRFEILGETRGITVIDDYAHHPTQIQGVLKAARQRFPTGRLIAVWEPHTFSRVKILYDDFMVAFDAADKVLILPIYAAREKDDGALSVFNMANDLQHKDVTAINSLDDGIHVLSEYLSSGDVVVLMGAGKEYIFGQQLLEKLSASTS